MGVLPAQQVVLKPQSTVLYSANNQLKKTRSKGMRRKLLPIDAIVPI